MSFFASQDDVIWWSVSAGFFYPCIAGKHLSYAGQTYRFLLTMKSLLNLICFVFACVCLKRAVAWRAFKWRATSQAEPLTKRFYLFLTFPLLYVHVSCRTDLKKMRATQSADSVQFLPFLTTCLKWVCKRYANAFRLLVSTCVHTCLYVRVCAAQFCIPNDKATGHILKCCCICLAI